MIVVIAILAAISIVAYTGIQNRAKEAAVRSDLSNFSRQAEMYRAEHDRYPNVMVADLAKLNFKVSQSAYPSNLKWNFDYCTQTTGQNLQYVLFVYTEPAKGIYVSSSNSSPREMSLSEPRSSGNPLPCYSGHQDSAADEAGLSDISSGRSGLRDGTWDSWLK